MGEDQLVAMLTGRNPVDGEPLLGTSGVPASGSVPGFDLTFSAPKSVSLLWGLGGADAATEVKVAHREAVQAALGYMQREACLDPTRRRRLGIPQGQWLSRRGLRPPLLAQRRSTAPHPRSRRQHDEGDGRWTRLYHPAIYDHATTASYIYEAHLRDELSRRLGVEWQPTRKGIAEIEGFADEHLRAFSTRRAEILEAAGENASAASRQVATLATRKPKEEADISQVELRQRWRSEADEIGLDREAIEQTLGVRDSAQRYPALTVQQLDRAVTEGRSHFDRRDAIQAVADSLRNGAQAADVERMADEFLASEAVIQIADTAKGPRYTTRRIWELEREALVAVERMNAERATIAGELIAARIVEFRPTLKADQRELVGRLLASPERVVVVIGEAGERRPASREPFEGYARQWIVTYRGRTSRGLSERTRGIYRRDMERWAIPYFRGCRLDEIEPPDVREFIGHLDDAGLRASTIRSIMAPVKAMYATAVEDGAVRANPTVNVRIGLGRGARPGSPSDDSGRAIHCPRQYPRAMAVAVRVARAHWPADQRGDRLDMGGRRTRLESALARAAAGLPR